MEQNTSLINFDELKEFIISNKMRNTEHKTRKKQEKNTCLHEYTEKMTE